MSPYNPDADPLVQRARSRSPRGRGIILVIVVLGIGAGGMWLYSNMSGKGGIGGGATTDPTLMNRAGTEDSKTPVDERGPYRYQFVAGEPTFVGMSARGQGKGHPALAGDNGLDISYDLNFTITGETVNGDGTADVRVDFREVDYYGNFLGQPVQMHRREEGFNDQSGEDYGPDTFMKNKLTPPNAADFDPPVYFRVRENGQLVDAAADSNFGTQFASIISLMIPDFPQTNLNEGDMWQSQFALELPGLKTGVPVLATSRLNGTGQREGFLCAEIYRELSPGDSAKMASAISQFVGKFGDALPSFQVRGETLTYFALDYGTVLDSQADVYLDLNMSSNFKAMSDLFGEYIGLLDELEGGSTHEMNTDIGNTDGEMPGFYIQAKFFKS